MLKQLAKRILGRTNTHEVAGEVPAEWYDKIFAETDEFHLDYWRSRYYFIWSVIADRLRSDGIRNVLEIGCGPAQLANMLFDRGLVDTYTGLDFSPVGIEMARANCPRGTFIVDDAITSSIYDTAEYDAIICTEVLEHVEADETIVSKFRKRCICTVPNFPYTGHVRHFRSEREVADRYSRFFKKFDVCAMKGHSGKNDVVYFLFDGVAI